MSVRKRRWKMSSGEEKTAWIVDYTDQKGERHIKTFATKGDAVAHKATVTVDISKGVHTSTKLTVAQAGENWIASCEAEELEASTIQSYRQHLRDHINPFLGAVKLSDLTVATVRSFRDRLREAGRTPAMTKRVVGDLGAILSDAEERGELGRNVVRSLNPRRKRKKTKREQKRKLQVGVDIPTPTEVRAIIAHLDGRWRPLLLTLIFAGLRASELRGLRWSDVDLRRGVLHVRQRADKFKKIDKPKSESGERDIPMPPALISALREWKLACPKSEFDLVFPTGAGQVEYHSNIVTRGLMPVQIAAGVVTKEGTAKYTGLHALRHFYASWCINRQKDGGLELTPKMVQTRLGHSTIQITMDTYGHLFPNGDDGEELAAAEAALMSLDATQTRHELKYVSSFNG